MEEPTRPHDDEERIRDEFELPENIINLLDEAVALADAFPTKPR